MIDVFLITIKMYTPWEKRQPVEHLVLLHVWLETEGRSTKIDKTTVYLTWVFSSDDLAEKLSLRAEDSPPIKLVQSLGYRHQKEQLVGGLNPSEKYESQLGWLFPLYMGK